MTDGFTPRRKTEPRRPTTPDRRNPVMERSMSHHRRGLVSVSVSETWRDDVHASLRW